MPLQNPCISALKSKCATHAVLVMVIITLVDTEQGLTVIFLILAMLIPFLHRPTGVFWDELHVFTDKAFLISDSKFPDAENVLKDLTPPNPAPKPNPLAAPIRCSKSKEASQPLQLFRVRRRDQD